MTGMDVTEAEIQHAADFLRITSGMDGWTEDDQELSVQRGHLIRILAWYGAIRSGRAPVRPLEVLQSANVVKPLPVETAERSANT